MSAGRNGRHIPGADETPSSDMLANDAMAASKKSTAWSRLGDFMAKAMVFVAVAALGYIGESGADGGFIKDIWGAAKTASPFAAMLALFLMLDERKERRSAQARMYDMAMNGIRAMANYERAMSSLTMVLSRRKGDR